MTSLMRVDKGTYEAQCRDQLSVTQTLRAVQAVLAQRTLLSVQHPIQKKDVHNTCIISILLIGRHKTTKIIVKTHWATCKALVCCHLQKARDSLWSSLKGSTVELRLTPLIPLHFHVPCSRSSNVLKLLCSINTREKRTGDENEIDREKHCIGFVAYPLSIGLWKAVIRVHVIWFNTWLSHRKSATNRVVFT